MKNRSLKVPAIIIIIGLFLSVAAYLLTSMVKTPTITEHDFNYSATYKLNGETKVFEGIYRCRFISTGEGTDPLERYYEGYYISNPTEFHYAEHVIDTKDDLELSIVIIFTPDYLMGERAYSDYDDVIEPYLAVFDKQDIEYTEEEMLSKFDAELISWELPDPVENTFVFAGFSVLHAASMLAMLLVGILVIFACIIFVRKDAAVRYTTLDKISAAFNFLIGLLALPFITIVVLLMQIYVSGEEIIYQIDLCLPALTAFTIAASLSLRRKGYTVFGFFLQFAGPVLFILTAILESFLP